MVALVTALRGIHPAYPARRLVAFSLALAPFAGCQPGDASRVEKSANAPTWAPDKLTSVQDVPATGIETLIRTKLNGPRLARTNEHQRGHTKRPGKEMVDAFQPLRRIASA